MTTQPLPDDLRDAILAGAARERSTAPAPKEAQPGVPEPRAHRTGRRSPTVSGRPLTARQKAVLCQMAAAAYRVQNDCGLVAEGERLEDWRRAQQLEAVGVPSLREAKQAHYLALRGHFEALAGRRDAATLARMTADAEDVDRQAAAEAMRRELRRFAELPDAEGRAQGAHRAEAYLLAIAGDRARGLRPESIRQIAETWPPDRIWTLVYTMRNRIARRR